MNTRDIVLLGAGVVVGYLLIAYMNKAKNNAQDTMESEDSTVDQAKIDSCNKSVEDFMATAKFVAGTDLEAIKKSKFEACMAKTV